MRATVLLVAAVLVVGAAAPAVAGAATSDGAASAPLVAQEDETNATTNETDNGTAPGAMLAGVAEVQEAEVEGEVERRTFGLQVAAANSNASKASVVANHTRALDQRLADLRERKQELTAARENETISESRYRGEMAGLAARISALQSMSNETATAARGLPAAALEAHGVNASAIDRLRTDASNLSGPEVAAIARNIAGPPGNRSAGPPFGNGMGGPPSDAPGSGDANETDGGPGNAPDDPGAGDAGNETSDGTSTPGADAPGNSGADRTTDSGANGGSNAGDGEPGSPDDAGNGNGSPDDPGNGNGSPDDPGNGNGSPSRPLLDWSVLADLLP